MKESQAVKESTAGRVLRVIEVISFVGPIAAIVGGAVLAASGNSIGVPFIVSGVIVGLLSLRQLERRNNSNE